MAQRLKFIDLSVPIEESESEPFKPASRTWTMPPARR
jgi:hypothetical protein